MKIVNKAAGKPANPAYSKQQPIGHVRRIDPSTVPAFLYRGTLARPGIKDWVAVFEITTDALRPNYERGDYLQLGDASLHPAEGLVVAKIRGVTGPILGHLISTPSRL